MTLEFAINVQFVLFQRYILNEAGFTDNVLGLKEMLIVADTKLAFAEILMNFPIVLLTERLLGFVTLLIATETDVYAMMLTLTPNELFV